MTRAFLTARDHHFCMIYHLVHSHRQGVFESLHDHAQGITHEYRIDPGFIDYLCKGIVISGEHCDLSAFGFLLQKVLNCCLRHGLLLVIKFFC